MALLRLLCQLDNVSSYDNSVNIWLFKKPGEFLKAEVNFAQVPLQTTCLPSPSFQSTTIKTKKCPPKFLGMIKKKIYLNGDQMCHANKREAILQSQEKDSTRADLLESTYQSSSRSKNKRGI